MAMILRGSVAAVRWDSSFGYNWMSGLLSGRLSIQQQKSSNISNLLHQFKYCLWDGKQLQKGKGLLYHTSGRPSKCNSAQFLKIYICLTGNGFRGKPQPPAIHPLPGCARLASLPEHRALGAFPLMVPLTSRGQRVLSPAFICKGARVCFTPVNVTEGDNSFESTMSLPKRLDKFPPLMFYHVLNG